MSMRIYLKENLGIRRIEEPVTLGLPFKKGQFHNSLHFSLADASGKECPYQISPLTTWNDGSIKWARIDFLASLGSGSNTYYELRAGEPPKAGTMLSVNEQNGQWQVSTGVCTFCLNKSNLFLFSEHTDPAHTPDKEYSAKLRFAINDRVINPTTTTITVENEGPVTATLLVNGFFQIDRKIPIEVTTRLHFFANKSLIKLEVTLKNPMAAVHSGGLWDLGDKGSVLFNEFSIGVSLPGAPKNINYSLKKGEPVKNCTSEEFLIYQESSGGENWQSLNHLNRENKIPLQIKGFEVREKERVISKGERSTPIVWIGGEAGVSLAMPNFWQNFPKAMEVKEGSASVALFPAQFPDFHELQGGEQKTEILYLNFMSEPSGLNWVRDPLLPFLRPEDYEEAGVIPNFKCLDTADMSLEYLALVKEAVEGETGFSSKREKIDQYGWRNFGEVYADHEALYHKGVTPFISHYNNQYDQIFGFLYQYLQTGDQRWYKLTVELNAHVRDIDIYRTDMDKDEISNGLFWHTDHYTEVGTCTHRTFSRHQINGKDPKFCGGGPGNEHCYTTGLMYNYLCTGDTLSKEAVLTLAKWVMSNSSASKTTLLGFLKNLQTKSSHYVSVFKGKKESAHVFPLSRGTGNYIVASLDAFELTKQEEYLKKAEELIKGCVHPLDDVSGRDLLDAEVAWSYTVFFSALGRYLNTKVENEQIDEMYDYAQKALLAYAEWMADNEYPYLKKKEILEFPNETWPAQDMRKSCIFYYAAKHTEGDRQKKYMERARFFFNSSIKELHSFPTRHFARPIALILQNGWVQFFLKESELETSPTHPNHIKYVSTDLYLTRIKVIKRVLGNFFYALTHTSIKREYQWLKNRVRSA